MQTARRQQFRPLASWHRPGAWMLTLVPALLLGMVSAVPAEEPAPAGSSSHSLFDGKSLGHWKAVDYANPGPVEVKDGMLILGRGNPMTGATWTGTPLPGVNYELTFEAQRLSGNDFFAAVTFPVKESSCSLILGGWGGGLTGLSSLNGADASENETTGYLAFENQRWYKVRVQVFEHRICCWVDEAPLVDLDTTDLEVGVRLEMEMCRPFGLASYHTVGAVRHLQWRPVKPESAPAETENR